MGLRSGYVRLPALAGAALLAMAGAALAQRDDPGLQLNCAGDYFKLCAGADPDGPEVEACFQRNRAKLSPKCRSAIGTYDRAHGSGDEDGDAAPAQPRRR